MIINKVQDFRMEYPIKEESYFLSLDEYTTFARRSIKRFIPNIANKLLKDNDFVTDVTHDIMMGDWRWNGYGSREGYRSKCAKWSILEKLKTRKKDIKFVSLDAKSGENGTKLHILIEDKKKHGEITEDHLKNFSLTKNQVEVLLRNLNGETPKEIAKSKNISNQAVSLTIKLAKEKIRKYYDKENTI